MLLAANASSAYHDLSPMGRHYMKKLAPNQGLPHHPELSCNRLFRTGKVHDVQQTAINHVAAFMRLLRYPLDSLNSSQSTLESHLSSRVIRWCVQKALLDATTAWFRKMWMLQVWSVRCGWPRLVLACDHSQSMVFPTTHVEDSKGPPTSREWMDSHAQCFYDTWREVLGNQTDSSLWLHMAAGVRANGTLIYRHRPSLGPVTLAVAHLIKRSAIGKISRLIAQHSPIGDGCTDRSPRGGSDNVCSHDDVFLSTLSDRFEFYVVHTRKQGADGEASQLAAHHRSSSFGSIREGISGTQAKLPLTSSLKGNASGDGVFGPNFRGDFLVVSCGVLCIFAHDEQGAPSWRMARVTDARIPRFAGSFPWGRVKMQYHAPDRAWVEIGAERTKFHPSTTIIEAERCSLITEPGPKRCAT